MDLRSEDSEQAKALERRVEVQAEAAKRAIGAYKKALRQRRSLASSKRIHRQREVELAVAEYIRLRRQLDELRAQTKATSGRAF